VVVVIFLLTGIGAADRVETILKTRGNEMDAQDATTDRQAAEYANKMGTVGTGLDPEQKKGQVETELEGLEHAVEKLESVVGMMPARLASVLRVDVPTGPGTDELGKDEPKLAKGEPALVTLASAVRNATDRIQAMNKTLQSMRDRLEL
jgi:hypothetical protein